MKNMPKKILKGKVVKNNRSKTITVLVERKYQHPVLKKVIKTKKKYHVHDEKNLLKVGDKVLFGKWSGTEVKIDGKEYSIMKESDIMGISSK